MSDIIRLLDSAGENVIDSVACDYEDSFCLETFGDLCEMHRQAEPKGKKSFIIARVQTWDPKQPDKAFYSYYNAFHLNKILFQTQNYLGKRFIHRLHVLNPLTNSDIIGNVQYFLVSPPKPDATEQVVEIPLAGSGQISLVPSKPGEPGSISIAIPEDTGETGPASPHAGGSSAHLGSVTSVRNGGGYVSPQMPTSRRKSSLRLRLDTGATGMAGPGYQRKGSIRLDGSLNASGTGTALMPPGRRGSEIAPRSPAIKEVEEDPTQMWTLANHSVSEAADEAPAPQAGMTTTAMAGVRRASAIGTSITNSIATMKRRVPFPGAALSPGGKAGADGKEEPSRKRAMSLVVSKAEDVLPQGLKTRRRTEFSIPIVAKSPAGPVKVHQISKAQAPPGVITRFTVPVPREELTKLVPKTYRGHRRSLSYQNAVSASGTPASFEEWVQMVQAEKEQIKDRVLKETGDEYDVVKPFAQGPRSSLQASGRDFKLDTIVDENAAQVASPAAITPGDASKTKGDGSGQSMPAVKASAVVDEREEGHGGEDDGDESAIEVRIYDAILIATDNDFLESSKTRALFRENAVVPEDAKLFEMPAYTGEEHTSPTVEIFDDSLLCEWCYPSPQMLAQSSPLVRLFHRIKCYLFAGLLAAMVFAFILVIVLQGTKAARGA
ncbi:hypothetical protein HK105_201606 [Polyrhizophydium stewartii]|uniref:Uncharacterized protein n=1 Tax=Polyrhizophydium stewartii TaxID=2732419 RepID=A0ABR4NGV4_9FUNG|nr:hypothetical protein HK105_001299 [Polyrhizophydium stewartii]